ncbi:hypothetical protein A0H81_11095 [Grifola frondosa]|uniref:histone acetyltransferase n=1 Tax=Grifola frondosa TaxID=5627 RepID=A0A1C7LXT5_GRIFR|nr:hypothetical protein A0H81_11095 [Grifola frondosa]
MFYSDPTTRPIDVQHLWIQLFARAQGQYLFPNSSDFSGKRPLSDVKLCAWWKRVFTDVSAELNARMKSRVNIKLYYILPGYNELEAQRSLDTPRGPLSADHPPSIGWIYGHPYSQHDIPLPCPQSSSDTRPPSLAQLIPSFDDDPKSRFMDEIAHTTDAGGVRSPKRKRPNFASRLPHADEDDKPEPERSHGELEKVSADEFWERMSFRQECTAGAMTGFFAMGISLPARGSPASAASPLAPQPGQVAPRMVRRVVATLLNHHEFSTAERAVRATETLEGAIKGTWSLEHDAGGPAHTSATA